MLCVRFVYFLQWYGLPFQHSFVASSVNIFFFLKVFTELINLHNFTAALV